MPEEPRPGGTADLVGLAETVLTALDASGVGMSITAHVDGRLERLYFNAAGARILGYSHDELASIPPMVPVVEEARPKLREMYESWLAGKPVPERLETELVAKDGRRIPVEVGLAWADYDGAPATIAFLRDISDRRRAEQDRKRLEAELLQADRLETVGTLAAGVAHEINNPLTYVLLNLERLDRELRTRGLRDDELGEMLDSARDGSERVRVVVENLLAFSAPDSPAPGLVDVGQVLQSALALAENAFRHGVCVETKVPGTPRVRASSARIGQILLNLLVNAAQAFSERHRGEKRVHVQIEDVLGWVVIRVADTGPGIAHEHLDHVFEPFFTTKGAGSGTGLGLAVTKSIVDDLGGEIQIDSKVGLGTTVVVTLPSASELAKIPLTTPEPEPIPEQTGLRVLLIDDEVRLARALASTLDKHYRLVTCTDPRDALDWLEANDRPDAVVCDFVMPHIDGVELYELATQRDPELARRFIFITGGVFMPHMAEFVRQTDRPVLRKPFRMPQLHDAIAAIRESIAADDECPDAG